MPGVEVVLTRVERLVLGDVFRTPQLRNTSRFDGVSWRKVTDIEDFAGNPGHVLVRSDIYPLGEALGRYDTVQRQGG